jgi:hypothetical protein
MLHKSILFGRPNNAGLIPTSIAAVVAFAILCILPLGDRSAAFAQCQYEITHSIIQGPPCGPSGNPVPIIPSGMNSMGHVVGRVGDCLNPSISYGFLWIEGVMSVLPLPQGVTSAWHYSINDHGIITGVHLFPGEGYTGFAYDPHTQTYHYLMPRHEGAVATTRSSANSVNNQGVIAGMRLYTDPGVTPARYNAVIWRPFEEGSPVEDLGDIGVGPNSSPFDISENAMVVGWTGTSSPAIGFFRDTSGKTVLIDPDKGADTSNASAVNETGYVVGTTVTISVPMSRAYLWHQDDGSIIIDPLPGFTSSQGKDINSVKQVLMRSSVTASNIVSTLWQNGSQTKLQDLVVGDSPPTLREPVSINDSGRVLVRVINGRGALLTPIEIPLGDLNYDCRVDYYDLLIMFEQWGPVSRSRGVGNGPSADLNGDGVVNITDLLILFDQWTN